MTYIEICEINAHLPLCRCIYVPEYLNLWKFKSASERDQRKTKFLQIKFGHKQQKENIFFYFSIFKLNICWYMYIWLLWTLFFTRKHHKLNCYTRIIFNWTSTNVIQNIMCWTDFTQEDSSYTRFLWNASKTDINNFQNYLHDKMFITRYFQ